MNQFRESAGRSAAKALSWRLLGTVTTSTIVFMFTGKWSLSLTVGGLELVSKTGLFWFHERLWDRLTYGRRLPQPSVIWFTGLSGSGKSTLSAAVTSEIAKKGLRVEHLDGDGVRALFPDTGFTKSERDSHIRRVGFLASKLERHGVFVVASFLSPYREARDSVRSMCQHFIEVHLSTPLEVCERRDVKGLYAKARRGELPAFTGVSDAYEIPARPELVIDTDVISIAKAVEKVLMEAGVK